MSKESRERGERKREVIRAIIFQMLNEHVKEKIDPIESFKKIDKHLAVMRYKNPQESCLVNEVVLEFRRDPKAFIDSRIRKEKEKHASDISMRRGVKEGGRTLQTVPPVN